MIPNGATRRWLGGDASGPRWIRATNRLLAPLASRVPPSAQDRLISAQRPGRPLLGPQPPTDDGPASLVDAGPLYAGMSVSRINELRPAADLVKALTP